MLPLSEYMISEMVYLFHSNIVEHILHDVGVTSFFFFAVYIKKPNEKKKELSKTKSCFPSMPKRRSVTEEKETLGQNVNKVVESVVEEATTLLAAEPPSKKWQNWWIRTITTLIMIAIFFLILASGYIWAIIMVMIITVLVYREVIQIAYLSAKGNMRWFKSMSW